MTAYELVIFINEIYETSDVANKHASETAHILKYCVYNLMDNIYDVELMRRVPQTNWALAYYIKKQILLPWKVLIFCKKKKMKI
jgi:hypothetical protein